MGEISLTRAKNGVFASNKVENGPKRANNNVFAPNIPFFAEILFVEHALL